MCETEQVVVPQRCVVSVLCQQHFHRSLDLFAKLGKNGLTVKSANWCKSMKKSALFCKQAPEFQVLLCLHKHTWDFLGIIMALLLRIQPQSCGLLFHSYF